MRLPGAVVRAAAEGMGIPAGRATTVTRRVVRKMNKRLVFFDLHSPHLAAPVPLVAKRYTDAEKGAWAHAVLTRLHGTGLGRGGPHRVVQGVAWVEPACTLVMEEAPGVPLREALHDPVSEDAAAAVERAGAWLAHLHALPGILERTDPPAFQTGHLSRFVEDLVVARPGDARRLRRIQSALSRPPIARTLRFLHGDLNPWNLFLARDGAAVAIDPDHSGVGDPLRDVGYLASQILVAALMDGRSPEEAHALGRRLVLAYERETPLRVDAARFAWYRARALLESLHYEACVLHLVNRPLEQALLAEVEAALWSPTEAIVGGAA